MKAFERFLALALCAVFLCALAPETVMAAEQAASTPAQLTAQLSRTADGLNRSLSIYMTDSLYRRLYSDDSDLANTVFSLCGIYTYSYSKRSSGGNTRVNLSDIVYYSGKKIAAAWSTGKTSVLNSREKQTLEKAENLMPRFTGSSLEKEKAIHDYICEHTSYLKQKASGIQEKDTAIGVLLNGQADCDGFSDAFYLLGTMAGLEVRHLNGYATNSEGTGSHMWNLLHLNGQWVMLDVTWDNKSDNRISYLYYNIGAERMKLDHSWNDEAMDISVAGKDNLSLQNIGASIVSASGWDSIGSTINNTVISRPERIQLRVPANINIRSNTSRLSSLIYGSGIKSFAWDLRPDAVELFDLEYYQYFKYCTTTQEAVNYLASLKYTRGIKEILLIFPEALWQQLSRNSMSGIQDVLYGGGLATETKWSYWSENPRVLITNPVFANGMTTVTSKAQLESYLKQALASEPESIEFNYGGALRLSSDISIVGDIVYSCGVASFSWSGGNTRIKLSALKYYPNYIIADSYEDVNAYIRSCYRNGIREFRVYMTAALYQRMMTNNASEVFSLLKAAGFTHYSLFHSDDYCEAIVQEAY